MAEANTSPANPAINMTLAIIEDKCESFTLSPYATAQAVALDREAYEFNFIINFNLNHITKQAKVTSTVKLLEKQTDNARIELAELRSSHLFQIVNLDEIVRTSQEGQMQIPNVLIKVCNSISVGSIRGMYSIKKENTVFEHAVLPLLDPKSLLPLAPDSK